MIALFLSAAILAAVPLRTADAQNAFPAKPGSGTAAAIQTRAEPFLPVFRKWENFTVRDGLPSNAVKAIVVDGDRIWAGTDRGLACRENGKWQAVPGLKDPVLCLAVCDLTGDLWIGSVHGLCRLSAGRVDRFNQFNSGLVSDIVYGVTCVKGAVWVATAAGVCRFDPGRRQWRIYDEKNTPMHEPWAYSICADAGLLYVAVWGGGLLEYHFDRNFWKVYRDPDGDMEIDLFPDDGLVHDVTSTVSYSGGKVWVGTYFGLSRYDGRRWKGFYADRCGLASDFINSVKSGGRGVWVGTDNGLSSYDRGLWVRYCRRRDKEGGEIVAQRGRQTLARVPLAAGPAHNFISDLAVTESGIWLATDGGVSHGFEGAPPPVEWRRSFTEHNKE